MLDATRAARASAFLKHADLSIEQVAFLVGFSQPTSFYRAFKRWPVKHPSSIGSAREAMQRAMPKRRDTCPIPSGVPPSSQRHMNAPVHTFPASQALQVVELVKRWGVAAESLLGPLGLEEKSLVEPDHRLPADTMASVLRRGRALTGEPGLGIYLGLQKRVSMYGFLGMATMTASTMREAIDLVVDLSHAVSTGLSLRLRVEDDLAALVVEEHVDFGDVRDIAQFSFFVGILHISGTLLGVQGGDPGVDHGVSIDMTIPKPDYVDRFENVLPPIRFGQPVAQMFFPAASLDLPLMTPDRATMELAKRQCEEQLSALRAETTLAGQVRRAMDGPRGMRGIQEVASMLHMSSRTLKRKLQSHGTTFTELREQERCQRALHLLRNQSLSVDEIAARLGYSSLSNFARAFQRWTACSPTAYRRSLQQA